MDAKGPSKRSRFARRLSRHEAKAKPASTNELVESELLQRPISVLAGHRIHELSDIREVSNSSKAATLMSEIPKLDDPAVSKIEHPVHISPHQPEDDTSDTTASEYMTPANRQDEIVHQRLNSRATSAISLPLREIPERRSSISILSKSIAGSRHASIQDLPSWRTYKETPLAQAPKPNRRADSPVRHAVARGTQSSEALRSSPSRTFIRTVPPVNILELGAEEHPRVELSVRLPSPLFVGGGTVEGQIELTIDSPGAKKINAVPILISKLSIDIIGVEETGDDKRHIFLSLASELFDEKHPPPPAMVVSQSPLQSSELCWETKPAQTVVPFCIHLPLNLGPPPYLSKHASIRYLLCPTASIRVGERRVNVRRTWNIQMLTVHNPEKALSSLPSPLLATDTLLVSQDAAQTIKLTAGLHRQIWVNGGMIFADIHVVNNTPKAFKKIELHLEKTTLWYPHAAAATAEKTASHLRLPKRSETEIVSSAVVKKNREWPGIRPQSSELRTCELEVPRGHVTISSGRYFEVRYFVGVTVTVSMFKSITVQLPVTIIHINSLDILPNSLAQVAASIEAKRHNALHTEMTESQRPQYRQGQAFAAARHQSLEKLQGAKASSAPCDIHSLMQDVDDSPRRLDRMSRYRFDGSPTPASKDLPENVRPMHSASHHHHERHPSCYHCHLTRDDSNRTTTSEAYAGPKLPRLQVSTSGLGFSESEFEISADSPPRKVMLSEQERKMINQQRELKLQRKLSNTRKEKDSPGNKKKQHNTETGYVGWKNVAATTGIQSGYPDAGTKNHHSQPGRHARRMTTTLPPALSSTAGPRRMRSKTNPEGLQLGLLDGNIGRAEVVKVPHNRQAIKSMDRGSRIPRPAYLTDDGAVFGNPKTKRGRAAYPPPTSFMRGMRHL